MPEAAERPVLDDDRLRLARDEVAAEGQLRLYDVHVTARQWDELLDAAPSDPDQYDRPLLHAVFLGMVTIAGDCDLRSAKCGDVSLHDVTIEGYADLSGIEIAGRLDVSRSVFGDRARFSGAHFSDRASFRATTFSAEADFGEAVFAASADFHAVTFGERGYFYDAVFLDDAEFVEAVFARGVSFDGTVFGERVSFAGTHFRQSHQIGPLLSRDLVVWHDAVFEDAVRIVVSARRLVLISTLFQRGGDLIVRWAEIVLDGVDFGGPSLFTTQSSHETTDLLRPTLGPEQPLADEGWASMVDRASPSGFEPRVLSLRNAKVAQLTLSGVDLRACQFAGAHGLDAMRLERVRFARTPTGRGRQLHRPRWTRRLTIAEEHAWRARHGHGPGWQSDAVGPPDWVLPPKPLEAEQIASIYRALRKGREDGKDEPGAADFYYGEMEMRRQQEDSGDERTAASATRWVVTSYWLTSGYGLRASRALAALALTLLLLAVPLDLWGFRPDRAYGRALLFAAQSSVSLLRAPTATLTASGQVVQIALRILGPVLVGLAAVSLRGRVKR